MRRSRSRLDLRAIVDLRPVAMVVGIVLLVLALAMLPSMLADLVAGHSDWQVFLLSASCTAFIGVSLILTTTGASRTPELSVRQGFLLTTLTWLTTTAFAALPFAFSNLELGAAGAFFEAMSGITTTGSTVIVGLEAAPPGILLWRAMLHWLGGIGIIVMGIAILPMLSIGGMQLFRTESTDSSEKILPRAAQIATNIAWSTFALHALRRALLALRDELVRCGGACDDDNATGGYFDLATLLSAILPARRSSGRRSPS
ncbi:MAG: potassium transporter TrkG [Geminicoccaceae bacterium]